MGDSLHPGTGTPESSPKTVLNRSKQISDNIQRLSGVRAVSGSILGGQK